MSSSPNKPVLKLDWCSHEAAKWAVEHWHYSKTMPNSKLAKVGAWENGRYIGCVIFGASANNHLGGPFGLQQTEICELVRIALTKHENTVSRIGAIAVKMLHESQPGLRLIVSFADPEHGHVGGIYQAMGWTYAGMTTQSDEYIVMGKRWHGRALRNGKPKTMTTAQYALALDPRAQIIKGSSKYRYLYPLDAAMRAQIAPLAKPYPKRAVVVQAVEQPRPSADGVAERPDRSRVADSTSYANG